MAYLILPPLRLGVGAVVNIALDYLFIAVYGWGLTGAAWATGISEVLSLIVIMFYFFMPERTLSFSFRQKQLDGSISGGIQWNF